MSPIHASNNSGRVGDSLVSRIAGDNNANGHPMNNTSPRNVVLFLRMNCIARFIGVVLDSQNGSHQRDSACVTRTISRGFGCPTRRPRSRLTAFFT